MHEIIIKTMVVLDEGKVVEIMREEWKKRLLVLEKSLDAFMKTPEGEKFVLGAGTKVKHVGSGLLYTIISVDKLGDHVTLQAPNGDTFDVTGDEFTGEEPEYELD